MNCSILLFCSPSSFFHWILAYLLTFLSFFTHSASHPLPHSSLSSIFYSTLAFLSLQFSLFFHFSLFFPSHDFFLYLSLPYFLLSFLFTFSRFLSVMSPKAESRLQCKPRWHMQRQEWNYIY